MILRLVKWEEGDFCHGDDAAISDLYLKMFGLSGEVHFYSGGVSIAVATNSTKYEVNTFSKKRRPDLLDFGFTGNYIQFGD